MVGLGPKNGMTLFSRQVWFTATHYQLAEAVGEDLDHLLTRGGLLELG